MTTAPHLSDRARLLRVATLCDGRYPMRRYTLAYRRADGSWEEIEREACERGEAVAVLPYCRSRASVVLTRQFRLPALLGGHPDGFLLEVPGGLADGDRPEAAARRETREETGLVVARARYVFSAYMSPAVLTEAVRFFVAEFDASEHLGAETAAVPGEDVEAVEVPFAEALAMIDDGAIQDGRTILLLQYAQLSGLLEGPVPRGSGG